MRSLFILSGVALAQTDMLDIDGEFGIFTEQFSMSFASEEEANIRKLIFAENLRYIQETNAQDLPYKLGVNQFTHLTSDEFKQRMGLVKKPEGFLLKSSSDHLGTHAYSGKDLPESIDWTTKGAVTPVKDQGHCGSCWSFSATGALEGRYAIATGKLVSLSEQNLMDCSSAYGNHGCKGGLMDSAFKYVDASGICTEKDVPYKATDEDSCPRCTPFLKASDVTGYKDVDTNDMEALMEAVTSGPVSVAVDASVWQSYESGILTAECGDSLDHGVLLVGYGTEGSQEFWKVKNSWAATWGEEGYIRLQKGLGSNEGAGQCGILQQSSYPVLRSGLS